MLPNTDFLTLVGLFHPSNIKIYSSAPKYSFREKSKAPA